MSKQTHFESLAEALNQGSCTKSVKMETKDESEF